MYWFQMELPFLGWFRLFAVLSTLFELCCDDDVVDVEALLDCEVVGMAAVDVVKCAVLVEAMAVSEQEVKSA